MSIEAVMSVQPHPPATARAHVLNVDNDPIIREAIADYLSQYEFRVTAVADGGAMHTVLAREVVDLIVLDQLPGEDGMALARRLRNQSAIPIVMLTGRREEADRVMGLELGADDYLTKPFGLRELLARIRAVLRRRETGRIASQREAEQGRCRFGGWQLDRRARRLTDAGGVQVVLTKGEYALLIAFLEAPQRPLTREHLLQATRIHEDVFDRSIDVQILRLRRKLETAPSVPRIIQTERGVGYVFALPVEPL